MADKEYVPAEFAVMKRGDGFLIKLDKDAAACLVEDIVALMDSEYDVPFVSSWQLVLQINQLWYGENGMNICEAVKDYSELDDLYEAETEH